MKDLENTTNTKLKDFLGNELSANDLVIYAARSNYGFELAKILELKPLYKSKKYYTPVNKLQLAFFNRDYISYIKKYSLGMDAPEYIIKNYLKNKKEFYRRTVDLNKNIVLYKKHTQYNNIENEIINMLKQGACL